MAVERSELPSSIQFIGANDATGPIGHKNIYGNPDAGIIHHNPGSLFEDPDLASEINAGYGFRSGHLPVHEARVPIVLTSTGSPDVLSAVEEHVSEYSSRIYGKQVLVATPDSLQDVLREQRIQTKGKASSIITVPYFNSSAETEFLQSLGVDMSIEGLDHRLVDKLHNKASFNDGVRNAEIAELDVPDFENIPLEELPERGFKFLKERVIALYEKFDMPEYREELTGLMLRTNLGAGGYNLASLVEDKERRSKNQPHIRLLSEGNKNKPPEYYSDWREALTGAQQYLVKASGPNADIVVSRFIDTEENGSPGMSVLFFEGNVASQGLNGQVQDELLACVGTEGFTPKTEEQKRLRDEIEDPVAKAFTIYVAKVAENLGIDITQERGFANVDLIIPGEREKRLMKKRGQKTKVYAAESNPRITNRIDAVMHVIEAQGKPITIANLRDQQQRGVLALDHVSLPKEAKVEDVRGIIQEIDQRLRGADGNTRLINRMPTVPVGIIFAGNIPLAREEFNREMRIYDSKLRKLRAS